MIPRRNTTAHPPTHAHIQVHATPHCTAPHYAAPNHTTPHNHRPTHLFPLYAEEIDDFVKSCVGCSGCEQASLYLEATASKAALAIAALEPRRAAAVNSLLDGRLRRALHRLLFSAADIAVCVHPCLGPGLAGLGSAFGNR